MSELHNLIEKYWDAVQKHRIWLHQHPEPSGQEKETAAYIAKTLREIGLEPKENIGGYGVVALIEGNGPGKCVGLRADFDALQITECTGLDFSSLNPGMAHSCGHDSHTAMLLGAAYVLNEIRDQFSGTIKLVFQPSEENSADSGAKKMIADGVLENPHVDAMLGQHVSSSYPIGNIATRVGALTSASDRFFITVRGKSSHGCEPESGTDAIVIASQVVTALQSIVARNTAPLESAVVTVGTFDGGTRYNIIADEVKMEGTCRNLDLAVRDRIAKRMEDIIKGITEGMGGTYEFTYIKGHPPTINHPQMVAAVREATAEVLGSEHFIDIPSAGLGGEDFSYYAQCVPSCFFNLGCRDMNKPYYPAHHGAFAPEWESLPIGMEVLLTAALKYLAQ